MALTRQTFLGKVMSLLFNTLSRLVITFLPGSKCLLISWRVAYRQQEFIAHSSGDCKSEVRGSAWLGEVG